MRQFNDHALYWKPAVSVSSWKRTRVVYTVVCQANHLAITAVYAKLENAIFHNFAKNTTTNTRSHVIIPWYYHCFTISQMKLFIFTNLVVAIWHESFWLKLFFKMLLGLLFSHESFKKYSGTGRLWTLSILRRFDFLDVTKFSRQNKIQKYNFGASI